MDSFFITDIPGNFGHVFCTHFSVCSFFYFSLSCHVSIFNPDLLNCHGKNIRSVCLSGCASNRAGEKRRAAWHPLDDDIFKHSPALCRHTQHSLQVSNTAQHQHQPPYTRSLPLSITRTHANKISPTALLNPAAQSANCSGENGLSHTEKKQGGEESRERKDNNTHSSQRRQRASWERPGGNSRTWWQRGWRRDRRRRGPRLGRRRERTEGWRQQWRIRQVLLLLLHPPSCPRVGQPVAAQWGMSCRNNQRQKRVRELLLQSPQSEGNYFVCPVNMDLQRSTLT